MLYPIRFSQNSGSSLKDVAYVQNEEEDEVRDAHMGVRFQVYMDDETLLKTEFIECLYGNQKGKCSHSFFNFFL